MTLAIVFALLVVAHALADYPLQGEFLSKAKNRKSPIPGVPWYQALGAHSVIHGGFVGGIIGAVNPSAGLVLGTVEAVAHSVIDDAKCQGRISYNLDQALHIGCKIAWVAILAVTA